MFKLKKQPSEILVGVAIDFTARMGSGETLVGGTIDSSLVSGTETSPVVITSEGAIDGLVGATVAGGSDGCAYKLTYKATGSLGNILESEIIMTVKEL